MPPWSFFVTTFYLKHFDDESMHKILNGFSWSLFDVEENVDIFSRSDVTKILPHKDITQLCQSMCTLCG